MLNLLKRIIPNSLHPYNYVSERILKHAKGIVQKGPFKGLKYIDEAHVGFVCHKVSGTYEKEIQHIIYDELNKKYDAIIDIGSAEGYYAVGMAKFSKALKIISFEGSERGRKLQFKLARLNQVDSKIEIFEYCEKEQLLEQMIKYRDVFIICDVDGFELALLDNLFVPQLNTSTMLIECHNHCFDEMENRFCLTYMDHFYLLSQTL